MFSNRHFGWKLGGALALVAAMGLYGAARADSINPALWRCLAEPDRWSGTRLWLPAARIVAVRSGDFDVGTGDPEVRIRVAGRSPAEAGAVLTLVGTFRAEGPRIDLDRSRILPPHFRLRWVVEAVSVVVALGALANLARHFLFRPRTLQAEGIG